MASLVRTRRQADVEIRKDSIKVAGVELAQFCTSVELRIAVGEIPSLSLKLHACSATADTRADSESVIEQLRRKADEIEAAMREAA